LINVKNHSASVSAKTAVKAEFLLISNCHHNHHRHQHQYQLILPLLVDTRNKTFCWHLLFV